MDSAIYVLGGTVLRLAITSLTRMFPFTPVSMAMAAAPMRSVLFPSWARNTGGYCTGPRPSIFIPQESEYRMAAIVPGEFSIIMHGGAQAFLVHEGKACPEAGRMPSRVLLRDGEFGPRRIGERGIDPPVVNLEIVIP